VPENQHSVPNIFLLTVLGQTNFFLQFWASGSGFTRKCLKISTRSQTFFFLQFWAFGSGGKAGIDRHVEGLVGMVPEQPRFH